MSSIEHTPEQFSNREEEKIAPESNLNSTVRNRVVETVVGTEESVLERARVEQQHEKELLERGEQRFEKYKERVESLRADLDAHKSNFIKRILERKRLADLRFELGVAEVNFADAEREKSQREELVTQYDKIIAEEKEVNSLLEDAYKENAEFDERKQAEFKKDEEGRDLKSLTQKHNVFFVHDIVDADWKPSENNRALDTKKLNFKNQLDIVLGLEPTISVSTLSPESKNRTFGGGWGVLLSSGRVLGGAPSDAGTVATGLRERNVSEAERSTEAITRAIERYGKKEERTSYNELVLERPQVAGIYFQFDEKDPIPMDGESISLKNTRDRGYDRWWKKLEEAVATGAPIFVFDQQKVLRNVHDINFKERSFSVTAPFNPEDMTDLPGYLQQHTTLDARARAVNAVLDVAPQIVPEEEKNIAGENPDYLGNSLNIY